jgi:uncharacterized protein
MTQDIVDKSIEFATKIGGTNIGIIFFGGEPLLKKDLILYAVEKCKAIEISNKYQSHYHFKITTNGLLLDEEFLEFSRTAGIAIGLSLDGAKAAHDANRKFPNGKGTFDFIAPKLDLLLKKQPYTKIFQVINPNNVEYYADSVNFFVEKGFKYIISSLNYDAEWTEKSLKELDNQYKKIAKRYKKWTLDERKFYFSPFEMKFATHIRGNADNQYGCKLSQRQISIAPDGLIYPCVQFVKDGISNKAFSIGNVWDGFNEMRTILLNESLTEKETCRECAIKTRCYNTCSCLNYQTTGMINAVSPLLCATERMLVPIVDALGAELYKVKAPMFIQKQYNTVYPLLSMLEDDAHSKYVPNNNK